MSRDIGNWLPSYTYITYTVMASGHVLRSVVLFLIFYTFVNPNLIQNPEVFGLSISEHHACSFYIANDLMTSTFKDLQLAMPRRTTNNIDFYFKASPNYYDMFLLKYVLLAEICSSLYLYCLVAIFRLILALMAWLHVLFYKIKTALL